MRRAFILWDVALQETPACAMGRTNLFSFEEPLKGLEDLDPNLGRLLPNRSTVRGASNF
jgi:hypothetical protein